MSILVSIKLILFFVITAAWSNVASHPGNLQALKHNNIRAFHFVLRSVSTEHATWLVNVAKSSGFNTVVVAITDGLQLKSAPWRNRSDSWSTQEFEKYVPYELLIPGDKGLYAAKNCWYADQVAYRELGVGMTGATYAVMPHGPQLDNYADLVDEILKADTTAVEPLSEEEMSIIKNLSKIFRNQRDAFDASHAESEWKKIENDWGKRISYSIAHNLTNT